MQHFFAIIVLVFSRVGDVVSIRGCVSQSFEHSVEVYVTVCVEDINANLSVTNDGWLTFVSYTGSLDSGSLLGVPKLVVETDEERQRMEGSAVRKSRRSKERKELKEKYYAASTGKQ